MDEEDRFEDCSSCSGTGISPTGRVEDSCNSCKGMGYIEVEPEDYDCDDYDDEPSEYEIQQAEDAYERRMYGE